MSENKFILKRKNAIVEERIKHILCYVIECYLLASKNKVKYSKAWVKNNTTIKFENYLRNRLVEDYLIVNKDLLKQKTLALNDINFMYEAEKEYIDVQDNKIKYDKIDIYINKLGLKQKWVEQDENLYFAIECKRIERLSDVTDYIYDIKKFINRNHVNTRLPFEGQIAFIEMQNISHIALCKKINEDLEKYNSIITINSLKPIVLNDKFNGTYVSKHQRNKSKQEFSIYHLFFDYSSIVVK